MHHSLHQFTCTGATCLERTCLLLPMSLPRQVLLVNHIMHMFLYPKGLELGLSCDLATQRLHGYFDKIEQSPGAEIPLRTMPVKHVRETHKRGYELPNEAVLRSTQWNIDISGNKLMIINTPVPLLVATL